MNNDLMMCARPGGKWYGADYDGSLDVKDIAKLIRKALKVELPGFKFSVNINRYSGGASINANLVDVPAYFVMAEYSEKAAAMYGESRAIVYSKALSDVLKKAEEIADRWNYDDSNSMVDYFSVNYYAFSGIKFASPAYEKEKADRRRAEEMKEAA